MVARAVERCSWRVYIQCVIVNLVSDRVARRVLDEMRGEDIDRALDTPSLDKY